MKSFPIQIRLTAWYSVILAVVLSLFGLSADFEMRNIGIGWRRPLAGLGPAGQLALSFRLHERP